MLTSSIPLIPVLILGIVSFSASCFVIIRTLLPIMPAHPLSRRLPRTAFGLPKRKLSPARKATLYIAAFDVLALAAFLWQAIVESLGTSVDPTDSAGSAARLWLAMTARQTCLLVVAALTLLYVRSGKTLTFGPKDFHVWAPTTTLVIVSAACAAGLTATKHLDSFYYGAITYTAVVAVISTGCFGGFLTSLLTIRRNFSAHIAAQEEEEWPPLKSQSKMYKPRQGASFAADDVEQLRDGSSWLTSIRSERTRSTSAFSFTSNEDAQSLAAPSSTNPYTSSVPAKSTFWFGIPSTNNLNQPEQDQDVPPVPELPAAYRRTSSPLGVEVDPFRREVPSTPVSQRNQTIRSGSRGSERSYADSWLTEPSGTVSTPTQFSFPSSIKSRPPSLAPSRHTRRTQTDEDEVDFDDVDLVQENPMIDYRDNIPLETPVTMTAFSPSPRASREILNNPDYYRPDSKATMVKPETPRPILGGAGAYEFGGIMEGANLEGNKAATSNLDPWRLAGWFISIWLPLVLALPYLAMNLVANPSASFASSNIPIILLTLSVTLSSPILALHVLFSASPVPILPSTFFATVEGRPSLFGSVHDNTVSSGGPRLPADMAERNPSQVTVHGRRSGDIWIENGHASDDGKGKLSRAIRMTTPIPKLACLDPLPSGEDERTLTNPTPEPGAFRFPHKSSASEPSSPAFAYQADPVIEAATRILAQQAADKADAARARLSSKVSAFTYATSTSYANEESDLVEELGVQQQARVMVAQRHFSSLAVANMVTIPPASIRSGPSNPTTPVLQIGGFAAAQQEQMAGSHSLKHSRSRSDMDTSVVRASGVSVVSRSSASSAHIRARSTSALLTPRLAVDVHDSAYRNSNSHRAPLTPPPSFPLPPTPPSVKALPHHQSRSASRQSHARSQSYASTRSARTMSMEVDSVRLGSAVMRSLRQPADEETWPVTAHSDAETTSSFKFTGFNPLDEEEVEALLVNRRANGAASVRANAQTGPTTPKKMSGSGLNKMASIPDSMMSFSSPEVHSTPKRSTRSRWRQHMSLPSLNLGKRGNHLKEEITTALAELGILVADEDGRRRTMYGGETPPRQQRSAASRATPSVTPVHTTVTMKPEVVVPLSTAARKSPARSSLTVDSLPPIAQRYSRSLTVDQFDLNLRTPSPTDSNFVVPHVENTPVAVAAPQRVAVTAPLQFHRPMQTQRSYHEKANPPTPVYHTINNELIRQIEVYRDEQESRNAPTKRASTPTPTIASISSGSSSSSAIPSNLRAQSRAWPPAAALFARAAGLAPSALAAAWSSSSSLTNDNNNALNQDLENYGSTHSSVPPPLPLPLYSKSSTGKDTTASPLRPLSLLQGRNSTTPAGTGKLSTTTPKSSSYVVARSSGKTTKSTTASSGKGSTGTLPLGPTPKSNKSGGRRGRQDENRTMDAGSTTHGSTPGAGLKPLQLARSATTKARGLLRQGEVVPDVVVRPPSVVYSYNQRDVMA